MISRLQKHRVDGVERALSSHSRAHHWRFRECHTRRHCSPLNHPLVMRCYRKCCSSYARLYYRHMALQDDPALHQLYCVRAPLLARRPHGRPHIRMVYHASLHMLSNDPHHEALPLHMREAAGVWGRSARQDRWLVAVHGT